MEDDFEREPLRYTADREGMVKRFIIRTTQRYGMTTFLKALVSFVGDQVEQGPEKYLVRLQEDLRAALDRYERRYEEEEEGNQ